MERIGKGGGNGKAAARISLGVLLTVIVPALLGCPDNLESPLLKTIRERVEEAQVVTHTISYDGNGNTTGSPPVDTKLYKVGETVTILGNLGSMTKGALVFTGWNTQSDLLGTPYSPGQTLVIGESDITLFASWTAVQTYRVVYFGNGNTSGSVPVDNTNYTAGQQVVVMHNTGNLVREHFTFSGWNTEADGTGVTYLGGQSFFMAASGISLYAKWTANPTYTVTYIANGGSGNVPVDGNHYELGNTVTVLGNTGNLQKTNFAFVGWNTKQDGTGITYQGGNTFQMGSDNVTLFAKWQPTFQVRYDGNANDGGTAPIDSNRYLQGAKATVLGRGTLTKTNHVFGSWNTKADGTGANYDPADTITIGTTDVDLYAQWTPGVFVTYDGNGNTSGSAPDDPTQYTPGDNVVVRGNTGNLAKSGYTFLCWNSLASGAGTNYIPSTTFNISSNTILYTKWVLNTLSGDWEGSFTKTSGALGPYSLSTSITQIGSSLSGTATLKSGGSPDRNFNLSGSVSGTSFTVDLAEIGGLTDWIRMVGTTTWLAMSGNWGSLILGGGGTFSANRQY